MKKYPVVLDLETKHTFREYKDPEKLGISVVAIYDYKEHKSKVFTEKELNNLFPILENSSYIIGYNSISFDLPVLQAYYPGKISSFSQFDILADIKEKIGRRVSLNDCITATLGKQKTGHGLLAIEYYKNGEWDKLKKYCLDDTLLTKELFEYGVENLEIFYLTEHGKTPIPVNWKKYLERENENNNVPLTLPF